jgi:hypothetical protein
VHPKKRCTAERRKRHERDEKTTNGKYPPTGEKAEKKCRPGKIVKYSKQKHVRVTKNGFAIKCG